MEAIQEEIDFLREMLSAEHRHLVLNVRFIYDALLLRKKDYLIFLETLDNTDLEIQWAFYCTNKPSMDIADRHVKYQIAELNVLMHPDEPDYHTVLAFILKAGKVLRSVQEAHFAELQVYVTNKLNEY